MRYEYPILRSLDPHHSRIGYLGALACVAIRGLDRLESLRARLEALLFAELESTDPRFLCLFARVPIERHDALLKRMYREQEASPSTVLLPRGPGPQLPEGITLPPPPRPSKPKVKPIIPVPKEMDDLDAPIPTSWLYLSELWLFDAEMPSPKEFQVQDQLKNTIEFGRWTGLLLPTLELSEMGFVLRKLLLGSDLDDPDGTINLLSPVAHPGLQVFYLSLLLRAEVLYPFLVVELVEREQAKNDGIPSGKDGLLRGAVDRMLQRLEGKGSTTDPEDMLALRDVWDFQSALVKPSTENAYLRPRMEHLVDLGLVQKADSKDSGKGSLSWQVTDVTRRLSEAVAPLMTPSADVASFLDQELFGLAEIVYVAGTTKVTSEVERLFWFTKAFGVIGRSIGFTPGRSLAMLACLMAWADGRRIELQEVFDTVYAAAKGEWESFLHFSGGSRFDQEFLIRVDHHEALPLLQKAVAKVQESQ